eukprot:9402719-Prorocentrum_lima.AAC.1
MSNQGQGNECWIEAVAETIKERRAALPNGYRNLQEWMPKFQRRCEKRSDRDICIKRYEQAMRERVSD